MKKNKPEQTEEIFDEFVLSIEEMICVKGGDGDPILRPVPPLVQI
ncbi:MAG: hypothetical protein WAL29_07490 [Bacteroidales bacterium]